MDTSRARMQLALERREPDRVPIDCNGCVTAIHEVAYRRLLDYLGWEEEVTVQPDCRAAVPSERMLTYLGCDTRYVFPASGANYDFKEEPDGSFTDEFGVRYKRAGYYSEWAYHPLKGASAQEVQAFPFPDPADPVRYEGLRERTLKVRRDSNCAIVYGPVYCIWYVLWMLRGLDGAMEDLLCNPQIATYLLDKAADWVTGMLDCALTEIGDLIDIFWVGDDWGIQTGPMISPAIFEKEMVPRFKRVISHAKTKTRAKCCFHSCGATYWALDGLLEMGVDIVHPLQPNAEGNGDSARIKREYGSRLSFHGGTNNQALFHGDARVMLIDTLERIKHLAPGGGYIFSCGHNIQASVPPENIVALYQCGREFGTYPIDADKIDAEIERLKADLAANPAPQLVSSALAAV
ncbi:MAG: hypothetical protein JXR37_05170 [Kiritimatiellae bacterium]|nr:hypothetical protein [Kiritimatiellia bacterium]